MFGDQALKAIADTDPLLRSGLRPTDYGPAATRSTNARASRFRLADEFNHCGVTCGICQATVTGQQGSG